MGGLVLVMLLSLADETRLLQGRWQLTAMQHGGKNSSAKEVARITLEVTDSKFTTRESTDIRESAQLLRVQSESTPATLDLKITEGSDQGKVVEGIWKREGKKLTICIAEPGKTRPKVFAGKEGTGHTLFTFERAEK